MSTVADKGKTISKGFTMALLQVRNLTKIYQHHPAVNDISFDVLKGETLGILGSNGAGKTTTISMLLGLLTPTKGAITYFGKNFFEHRSETMQEIGSGTAYAQLPSSFTIFENLDIMGRFYGLSKKERHKRIQALLERLDMWRMHDARTGDLSSGEMTRVILAKAFLHQPRLVLLDEPTASLDVDIAKTVRDFVKEQHKLGIGFIITSHNMPEMTELCDRIMVMDQGKIVTTSTPHLLAKSLHKTKIILTLSEQDVHNCVTFSQEQGITYHVDRLLVTIEIDEQEIAQVLTQLAQRAVNYSHISIQNPTLEDYFITLQKERREKKLAKTV